MGTRIASLGLLLALAVLVPSIASGQTYVTKDEFNAAVSDLKTSMKEINDNLGRLVNLKKDVDEVKALYRETGTSLGDLQKEFRQLKSDFEQVKSLYNEHDVMLRQIAVAVGDVDENGRRRHVPNIMGNMKYPAFKTDLTSAVHDVMQQSGTLRLYNKMSTAQVMRLAFADRSEEYVLAAGQYRDVPVRVGTLTTQLLNSGEGPKNWTIAPPTYFQEVDIVPREYTRVVVEPEIRIVEPAPMLSTVIGPPIRYPVAW